MADIANTNITTTILTTTVRDDNRKEVTATLLLAFGASLTYPSGGVPLLASQFGFGMVIDDLIVLNDNGVGYLWEFMPATKGLRMIYPTKSPGSTAVGIELTGGVTAPGTNITIQVYAVGR
jgi:hypothetical protein